MVNAIKAADNDERDGDENLAETGFHGLLAYHMDDFMGAEGFSKVGILGGVGLGAEAKRIGADGDLTKDAKAVCVFAFGTARLPDRWRIAPSFLAEYSADRYVDGDKFIWAGVNTRFVNEITQNFEMQYEASYQYMDLDTGSETADGSFYKVTVAPTLKFDSKQFFGRPELRLFATFIDWDDDLERFDVRGGNGFSPDSNFIFGGQMEVWF